MANNSSSHGDQSLQLGFNLEGKNLTGNSFCLLWHRLCGWDCFELHPFLSQADITAEANAVYELCLPYQNLCVSKWFQSHRSEDSLPAIASSRGARMWDIAGVAICSVLFRPMNLHKCLVLVSCSSLAFKRDFYLCKNTSRYQSFLHIHSITSQLPGKILVF